MGHDRDIWSTGYGSRDRGQDFGVSTDILVPLAAELWQKGLLFEALFDITSRWDMIETSGQRDMVARIGGKILVYQPTF